MALRLLSLDEMKLVSGTGSESSAKDWFISVTGSSSGFAAFEEWYRQNGHNLPGNHNNVQSFVSWVSNGGTSTVTVTGQAGIEGVLRALGLSASGSGGYNGTSPNNTGHMTYAAQNCSGCHR